MDSSTLTFNFASRPSLVSGVVLTRREEGHVRDTVPSIQGTEKEREICRTRSDHPSHDFWKDTVECKARESRYLHGDHGVWTGSGVGRGFVRAVSKVSCCMLVYTRHKGGVRTCLIWTTNGLRVRFPPLPWTPRELVWEVWSRR